VHEYGLTLGLIEAASKHANGARVTKIALVIGEASDVLGDSIRLCFDLIAEGTPCYGAAIEIETTKPMLRCNSCGGLFERKPFSFDCPCGGEGGPTEIGREYYIKYIEVEPCQSE